MSFWKNLLGIEPPAPPPLDQPGGAADLRERTQAERHKDRFARAVLQAEEALPRGETSAARLAQLQASHRYYTKLAALEANAPHELNVADDEEGES